VRSVAADKLAVSGKLFEALKPVDSFAELRRALAPLFLGDAEVVRGELRLSLPVALDKDLVQQLKRSWEGWGHAPKRVPPRAQLVLHAAPALLAIEPHWWDQPFEAKAWDLPFEAKAESPSIPQLWSRIAAAAEVAVGGSHGAARQFGLPGPGDVSNLRSLVKLSDEESAWGSATSSQLCTVSVPNDKHITEFVSELCMELDGTVLEGNLLVPPERHGHHGNDAHSQIPFSH
jgi:hypothetical protein